MKSDLVMKFLDADGKKVSVRLRDVKEDVTEEQVKKLMDLFITKNLFSFSKHDLFSIDSAQIINTDVKAIKVK